MTDREALLLAQEALDSVPVGFNDEYAQGWWVHQGSPAVPSDGSALVITTHCYLGSLCGNIRVISLRRKPSCFRKPSYRWASSVPTQKGLSSQPP